MSEPDEIPSPKQSRRSFLKAGGAALGAASTVGLPSLTVAKDIAKGGGKRGGILRFATRFNRTLGLRNQFIIQLLIQLVILEGALVRTGIGIRLFSWH